MGVVLFLLLMVSTASGETPNVNQWPGQSLERLDLGIPHDSKLGPEGTEIFEFRNKTVKRRTVDGYETFTDVTIRLYMKAGKVVSVIITDADLPKLNRFIERKP